MHVSCLSYKALYIPNLHKHEDGSMKTMEGGMSNIDGRESRLTNDGQSYYSCNLYLDQVKLDHNPLIGRLVFIYLEQIQLIGKTKNG